MKSSSTNPFGQYRKKPTASLEEFQDFSFTEIDGVKVLDEASNCTVTSILMHGPALEREVMQAMTYSQRLQKRLKHTVAPCRLRAKFPTIDKFCDDDQVQEIACSELGKLNPHKHAVHIISERLQISPGTVDRYFRNPTIKKTEDTTKPSKPQKS
jgi:hypothetical protein